ncbi:Pumilio-like protein 1 [Hordeum vulgare]|nr:Pumilio-like protein 1 [Hordeum vulgare]
MAEAMPSKPSTKVKQVAPKPKKTTRDSRAANKNKGSTTKNGHANEDIVVLRKLGPHPPEHNDDHPFAKNMKERKDQVLRRWRANDQYVVRRRTIVNTHFHTKEQHDFYENVVLEKNPVVSDMRYVDWKYIKSNEDYSTHVQENFKMLDIDEFIGKDVTTWNDELIMKFYSTPHFYPDGRIVWMTERTRYHATSDEWATILGVPKVHDRDLDVYSDSKMNCYSMSNMYTPITNEYMKTHKFVLVYFLQAGLTTSNTILRHTLMPKLGDDKMIHGYSINILHHVDNHTMIRVMDLIAETIKRTPADQKRSCGHAPYIQMLINSKV